MADTYFLEERRLKIMLANSATFRSECNTADAAATLPRIHLYQTLTEFHRAPRATIFYESWRLHDEGRHNWVERGVVLRMTIELLRTRPQETSTAFETQEQEVLLKFGTIIDEMRALAGTGTGDTGVSHLNVTAFEMVPPGLWMEAAEETDQRDKQDQQIMWWMQFLVTCN